MFGVAPLKGVEYAFQARICIRRRDKILGGRLQDCSAYIGPVLQHHLETARAADAVHRRWFDRDDEGVLDPRESLIYGRQNGPGRLGPLLPFLGRLEDLKDRALLPGEGGTRAVMNG